MAMKVRTFGLNEDGRSRGNVRVMVDEARQRSQRPEAMREGPQPRREKA